MTVTSIRRILLTISENQPVTSREVACLSHGIDRGEDLHSVGYRPYKDTLNLLGRLNRQGYVAGTRVIDPLTGRPTTLWSVKE